jgi:hypothetical protein
LVEKYIDIRNLKRYNVKTRYRSYFKFMEDDKMTLALIITGGVFATLGMIFLFINKWVKNDHEIEKIKLQNASKELDIKQMEMRMKLLEEEDKKYDRIINENKQ